MIDTRPITVTWYGGPQDGQQFAVPSTDTQVIITEAPDLVREAWIAEAPIGPDASITLETWAVPIERNVHTGAHRANWNNRTRIG